MNSALSLNHTHIEINLNTRRTLFKYKNQRIVLLQNYVSLPIFFKINFVDKIYKIFIIKKNLFKFQKMIKYMEKNLFFLKNKKFDSNLFEIDSYFLLLPIDENIEKCLY